MFSQQGDERIAIQGATSCFSNAMLVKMMCGGFAFGYSRYRHFFFDQGGSKKMEDACLKQGMRRYQAILVDNCQLLLSGIESVKARKWIFWRAKE
jgi:hypothetical protein